MGLFNRKPRDTSALHSALSSGTMEDFLAVYVPAYVHYNGYSGRTLLELALGNGNLEGKVQIADKLLDDGADVTVGIPLHILVGGNPHDIEAEAPLLQRRLELGADVNKVTPKSGTPLEAAAARFKYTDKTLTPFYDVPLARPDLDLLQPALDARPVRVNLRKCYAKRADLVERCESLLRERGIPVPEPAS